VVKGVFGGTDEHFIFPSVPCNGKQPLSPDALLKKVIRHGVKRAGIKGKTIGWHSFRHPLAAGKKTVSAQLEGCNERNTKRCGSSAPSEVPLDFAKFHKPSVFFGLVAGTTGLEPATSAVTEVLLVITRLKTWALMANKKHPKSKTPEAKLQRPCQHPHIRNPKN
jgi:hypothetical protein